MDYYDLQVTSDKISYYIMQISNNVLELQKHAATLGIEDTFTLDQISHSLRMFHNQVAEASREQEQIILRGEDKEEEKEEGHGF